MDEFAISNEIQNLTSVELLEYIALKKDFPDEAKQAFEVFCMRFQECVLKCAEVHCDKWTYNEVVALDIAHCTFERVWKYPSFKISKAKASDLDKAISMWLFRIVQTQLANHYNNETCHEPSNEEDLSIITDTDELVDYTCSGNVEKKKELRKMLEVLDKGFSGMSPKHKIIYLTYKAYEKPGKRVPRSVLEKLRDTLNLTQSSIKVYKNEANGIMDKFLNEQK